MKQDICSEDFGMVWLIVTVPKFKAEGCWRHYSVLSSKSRYICACPSAQDSACANCHSGGVDALETFKDNVGHRDQRQGLNACLCRQVVQEGDWGGRAICHGSKWKGLVTAQYVNVQRITTRSLQGDTKRRKDEEQKRFRLGEAKASPSFTWSFQSRWVCAETASAQGDLNFLSQWQIGWFRFISGTPRLQILWFSPPCIHLGLKPSKPVCICCTCKTSDAVWCDFKMRVAKAK